MIATRPRRSGYGHIAAGVAIGLAIGLALAASSGAARASSIAVQTIRFGQAVTLSPRVVKGTVKARSEVKVDGATFHYVEIAVDAALKGPPAKAGERVRVFNGAQWFQHTHAAAIKAGVVSYADSRYATPIPDAQIKAGTAVIVFLRGETPPPVFPANAAFLTCGEAYERPERAADVARIRTAAFGDPITLKMGEIAVLPDGLEVEVRGHTHKRPLSNGPQKAMTELEARSGTRRERFTLAHEIEPGTPPKETWQRRQWQEYELVLVGMNYDSDSTLRIVRRSPP